MLQNRSPMGTNTILVAIADPQALAAISQALGTEWMPTAVRNEPEAAAQLKKYSFTAFLVDFNLGSPDASQLLDLALQQHPETTRFLLAYEADLALVAAKVNGTHHVLPKPLELAPIKSRIEEGVAQQNPGTPQQPNDAAAGQRAAAKIPAVYAEVIKALETPEVTSKQVGKIIGRNKALTAEVLRLAGSSYPGLPRKITRPAEAVESLGMEAVKVLVMALRYLAEQSQVRPGYLSVDDLWQHSTRVAQIARDLVLFETKDRALAAEAFAAGLIHDFGKVVLATNFEDLYGRVHSLARNHPVALWDAEREMFGANHGEIGGCLVGMWNLPASIVEAVALHHEPAAGAQQELTPLAAVHIANVLQHQLSQTDQRRVAPVVDTAFLNGLGLLPRLPVWHAAFAKNNPAGQDFGPESAETEPLEASAPAVSNTRPLRTGNQLAGPAAATCTSTTGQPESDETAPAGQGSRFSVRRWVYACAAATLLLSLTIWVQSALRLNAPLPVNARPRAEAPQTVPAPSFSEPASEAGLPAKPEERVEAAAAVVPAVSQPAPSSFPTEPASAMASQQRVNEVPPPATAPSVAVVRPHPPTVPAQNESQEFRLSGMIYSVSSPMAIVNGVTVHVGDKVNGATVAGIGPKGVTLQIAGRNTALSLK
jgi:HD-like signal output (HDOD) protein